MEESKQESMKNGAKPGRKGLRRIIWAAYYSWRGFRSAFRYETAFRQESILVIVSIPFALWLGHDPVEYAVLIGSGLLVLLVELLNSAVEAVVDRIGSERHELSGQAKDMGSAAVFVSLLIMMLCWGGIGLDRIL